LQRATAQLRTGLFRGWGVAEAPPVFQAGWFDCMYFSIPLSVSFAHLEFLYEFCTCEGTVPYRSSAQMSFREEVVVSFVVLGILEPQTARH
jgi:hypothetical protein